MTRATQNGTQARCKRYTLRLSSNTHKVIRLEWKATAKNRVGEPASRDSNARAPPPPS